MRWSNCGHYLLTVDDGGLTAVWAMTSATKIVLLATQQTVPPGGRLLGALPLEAHKRFLWTAPL